jgi:hypothetical protein
LLGEYLRHNRLGDDAASVGASISVNGRRVDGLRLGGVRGDGKGRSEEIHDGCTRCVGWMMLRNCPRIIAQAPLLCGWSSDLDKFGAMLVIVVVQHFLHAHLNLQECTFRKRTSSQASHPLGYLIDRLAYGNVLWHPSAKFSNVSQLVVLSLRVIRPHGRIIVDTVKVRNRLLQGMEPEECRNSRP